MDNIDIIQIIGSNSPAIAFTIYLLYQMRNDRADALRREIARSEELRADKKEQMALQREMVESAVRLERQLHELKNVIQAWVLDSSGRNSRSQGAQRDTN